VDVNVEDKATFQQMADDGVMNSKLIHYPDIAQEQWTLLSKHIRLSDFEKDTRFNITLEANDEGILAAFQLSFLKMIVYRSDDLNPKDFEVWENWIKTFYAATPEMIDTRSSLFVTFLDLLMLHLQIIPRGYRTAISFVDTEITTFIAKFNNIDTKELRQKIQDYEAFLKT